MVVWSHIHVNTSKCMYTKRLNVKISVDVTGTAVKIQIK